MNVQSEIEQKISHNIDAAYLQVENESFRHAVPKDSETHFKVTVVSKDFDGMALIARHRMINALLKEQLAGPVHALALHAYTLEQWEDKNRESPDSANCLGGGK